MQAVVYSPLKLCVGYQKVEFMPVLAHLLKLLPTRTGGGTSRTQASFCVEFYLNRVARGFSHPSPDIRFDCIIGRNALIHEPDKGAAAKLLAQLLQQSGVLVLAETVPRHTQRLYRLLDSSKLDADLYQRLVAAEEAIYTDKLDPMVNWDTDELRVAFESVGLVVEVDEERELTQLHITPALMSAGSLLLLQRIDLLMRRIWRRTSQKKKSVR
jgi:hypothetical protein